MDWSHWIREHHDRLVGVIRHTGLANGVFPNEVEDYVSQVFVRLLTIDSRARFEGERWNLVKVVAKRQAVDNIRRAVHRGKEVSLEVWTRDKAMPNVYAEVEILDQVRRLGRRDARAVLGPALGFQDVELVEDGRTRDAVSQRRKRARERLAA